MRTSAEDKQSGTAEGGKKLPVVILSRAIAFIAVVILVTAATACSSAKGGTAPDQGAAKKQAAESSQYAVSINDCTVQDGGVFYKGETLVVFSLSFTNNSDEAISYQDAIRDKVYQNGVQIDFAFLGGDTSTRENNEVKPGATATFSKSFRLIEAGGEVSIECRESGYGNKPIIAEAKYTL